MPKFITLHYPVYNKTRYSSEDDGKIKSVIKLSITMKHEIMKAKDITALFIYFDDIMVSRNNCENKKYNDMIPCGSHKETIDIFNQISKILCSNTTFNNVTVYPSFNRIEKELDDCENIIIDVDEYNKIATQFKTMNNECIDIPFIIEDDNSFKYLTNEEYKKYLEDNELKEYIKNEDVMFPPHMLPTIWDKKPSENACECPCSNKSSE